MKKRNILIIGSEGLIGKFLVKKLKKNFNCFEVDIKKISKQNYFFCDLKKTGKFKQLLRNFKKKNIYAAINLAYPFKSKNFIQDNHLIFERYINSHIISYYNFNKYLFDFLKNSKEKKIIINFSSIYGLKIPNFNIYKGTNIKMPIEYAISKSAIIMMTRYFNKWSKYKKKNISFCSICPAGIESNQSAKFKKNYKKFYKKKMLNLDSIFLCVNKILNSSKIKLKENIIITGGAKI